MSVKFGIVLVVFLSWFLSSGISAEGTLTETYSDSDSLEFTLPEVIVEGDSSMHSLRMEVIHAEEIKFEVFNNLNSTDDFDITCEWHAPLGTNIKRWSCDVGYMKKARADGVRDWMQGHSPILPSDHKLLIKNANRARALNKEMRQLAAQHPELAIAIINAHELEQLYKQEQKKRYKDSIFVGHPEPDLALNKLDIWAAAFEDHSNGVISDATWKRLGQYLQKNI